MGRNTKIIKKRFGCNDSKISEYSYRAECESKGTRNMNNE